MASEAGRKLWMSLQIGTVHLFSQYRWRLVVGSLE
jgi:hypothetical protein